MPRRKSNVYNTAPLRLCLAGTFSKQGELIYCDGKAGARSTHHQSQYIGYSDKNSILVHIVASASYNDLVAYGAYHGSVSS